MKWVPRALSTKFKAIAAGSLPAAESSDYTLSRLAIYDQKTKPACSCPVMTAICCLADSTFVLRLGDEVLAALSCPDPGKHGALTRTKKENKLAKDECIGTCVTLQT